VNGTTFNVGNAFPEIMATFLFVMIVKRLYNARGYHVPVKLKKGHVTVFPNDVQGLCSNVLPHPLCQRWTIFMSASFPPRKPIPTDVEFVLAVNPQRLKRALVWLKDNNPLYHDIRISNEYIQSWDTRVLAH
jgi:hypothetical protein